MIEAPTELAATGQRSGSAPLQEEREIAEILPRQPRSVRDTGLDARLVADLVLKTMQAVGKCALPLLAARLRLAQAVVREALTPLLAAQLVELAWSGESDIDAHYQLTAPGERAAEAALTRSRYLGPAPVTLATYRAVVEQQSLRRAGARRVTPAELDAALADEALSAAQRTTLGAALHSARALLLHGPSGCGKTTLARKLARLLPGPVAVPYAVLASGQIIQLYDARLHPPAQLLPRQQEDRRHGDARWMVCQRPLVHLGGNLGEAVPALRHDAAAGVCHAPPHLQANNGLLIVDDLDRQPVPAAQLLQRWLGPLGEGLDQLTLPGGHSESMPFDATVVFVSALAPHEIGAAALLRRLGYQVALGALPAPLYRAQLRRQCRLQGVAYDDAGADYLIDVLHACSGRALLAVWPAELVGRIADHASYAGGAPCLSRAALEEAWASLGEQPGAAS